MRAGVLIRQKMDNYGQSGLDCLTEINRLKEMETSPREASHRSEIAMLRIGTVMGVPTVLRNLGLNPSEVLSEGGFDPHIFDDPDNRISFSTRNKMLVHCAEIANCEHFGVLMGQEVSLYSVGLLGLLVKHSPDVETALRNLARYFHLHSRGSSISLEEQGSTAILGFRIHTGGVDGNNMVSDGALAILFNVMRELCGPGWKPTEILFMHNEPANIAPFRQFFKVRMRFSAEQNALVFASSCLKQALPEVDSEVLQMVQKQIDSLATRHEDNFPEQVRSVLRAALVSGEFRADQIAALFSIHPRTLNRRLVAFGFKFHELLDETRFEMAGQLLTNSSLGISEIALMLHYADARSFIRAFRRWSGKTPARWRASRKQKV
jgi:AraC-like DNA-binding protein